MRRVVLALTVLAAVLVVDAVDAARRASGAVRAGPRRRAADTAVGVFDCDTSRGVRRYGSTARCLRALCAGGNLVNRYQLDAQRRLRRNPCAGIDPFDRDD